MEILSLGAGRQSSTLFLMSCVGQLPKLDAAIFADTQWEPAGVYETLAFLDEQGQRAGIPVHVVTRGDIREDMVDFRRHRVSIDGKRFANAPFFVLGPNGEKGRMKRQCTSEYKIEPVERAIREILGYKPRQRYPREVVVNQWLGISLDEAVRAKPPGRLRKVKKQVGSDLYGDPVFAEAEVWKPSLWKTHCYPFLDLKLWPDRGATDAGMLPRRYTAKQCVEWLAKHFPGREFPRSACIGCPFRSNLEWADMKARRHDEWADAVAFDRDIRLADARSARAKRILVGDPFVHQQRVPLNMVNLGKNENDLFGEECEGVCGV